MTPQQYKNTTHIADYTHVLFFTLGFLISLTSTVQATPFPEQAKRFEDGVTWAKNINVEKAPINVENYCTDNDLNCKTKVHRPDQAGMNNEQINSRKTTAYFNDEQAKAVQGNFDKGRPTIDPNDETYRMALIGQDNAYEITHGISTAYADCESGMTCNTSSTLQYCSVPTNNPVGCEKTPYVMSSSSRTGVARTRMKAQATSLTFKIPRDATRLTRINMGFLFVSGRPSPTSILLNGVEVAKSAGGEVIYAGSMIKETYNIDISNNSATSITFSMKKNGRLVNFPPLHAQQAQLHWRAGKNKMGWRTTCKGLLPECKKISETCVKSGGTRTINGIPTTLSCWKYRLNYRCDMPNTCIENLPYLNPTCKSNLLGVCIENSVQQKIENKTCKEQSLICGEESFCLEGDCYEPTPTQSEDFSQAASMLAAVSKAAEDITDPPLIFTGKNQQCEIKIAGIANCCKDGGWGTDMSVTSCSSEEKALGRAQEEKLTIALGSYCAKKVLGVCTRKKRSYCVFDSKLARIIQQHGKPQIGKGFGSAKNPDCSAITPEEMQQMDFSQIDFSDFYSDMQSNANLPNTNEIKARIESAYGS